MDTLGPVMVKNRHIPEVRFAAPAGTPAGIEVMSLAQLRPRLTASALARPQRPTFHHLLTVDRGRLVHTVDFTRYELRPADWLWVRPSQVQQWGDLRRVDGRLILFEREFLDPATASTAAIDDPHAPAFFRPAGPDADDLRDCAALLDREFHAFGRLPLETHLAVLRHLLAALVLRLAHATTRPGAEPNETFLRFRAAVERDFTRTRRVEDYAHLLGYSPRTLSRATLAATGIGAKEFIDRRVILEAKRLLAHSDQPANRIAHQLGFSSATNFSKYFQQRTGMSPISFRSAPG
jgi:AraC-like DNA-binding protein